MALSLAQLASSLRLTDGTAAPGEPIDSELTRLQAAATALIDKRTADAPQEVRNEAVVLLTGYWYDQAPAAQGDQHMSAWRYSGAASLLAPWTIRRTGITEAA